MIFVFNADPNGQKNAKRMDDAPQLGVWRVYFIVVMFWMAIVVGLPAFITPPAAAELAFGSSLILALMPTRRTTIAQLSAIATTLRWVPTSAFGNEWLIEISLHLVFWKISYCGLKLAKPAANSIAPKVNLRIRMLDSRYLGICAEYA